MKSSKHSGSFFNNFHVKALCFLLAVLVYFLLSYVVQEERHITMPLEIIFPEGYKPTSNVPNKAEVVIKGSEQQIYMIDVERIRLYADFSDVKNQGVASSAIHIDCQDILDYIDISDISLSTKPSIVKIYFE